MTNIPVVDISTSSDPDSGLRIATALAQGCKDVGFVYVTGHGIPTEDLQEIFKLSQRFFALPFEEKMKAPHPKTGVLRGYSSPGMEQVKNLSQYGDEASDQIAECKESYDVGSDQDTMQSNIWLPEDVLPGFRPTMTAFYKQCEAVSRELIRLISIGIGLDESALVKHHSGHYNQLRLLHYPKIQASEVEKGIASRMPAHTDWGTITLLFQDNAGGLEIEDPHKPGTFIAAPPVENALVMNIGDILMRWSNDLLLSSKHRVVLPDQLVAGEDSGGRVAPDRYSIPYFVGPDPTTVVECLETCISSDRPAKYAAIGWGEYLTMKANSLF